MTSKISKIKRELVSIFFDAIFASNSIWVGSGTIVRVVPRLLVPSDDSTHNEFRQINQ